MKGQLRPLHHQELRQASRVELFSKENTMPKETERASVGPEADAKGQTEKKHKGGSNDGISSADPRVISEKKDGDATFPLKQDKPKGR
ncbi:MULTISPECIES: hypothetical protein [unclassified Mesorhizobium]|uniref:hypothetical protein n=1 Tax=unclassified Mesorhizobium TaxID=325217 RepID=UPI001CC9A271|nr:MULTISPECIES: hypothetical protein [unclassified Mesorhizobium]MBZ9811223.1 hypothetical protein [Mesorhizobium sp. ESP-6-2]MBZ9942198.1 hypothetical protein [Mesorhizobium sp. BR1-1-13]